MKDEQLQNRREFFKNAAKAALPILGGIVLMNLPLTAKASQVTGCDDGCSYSCKTSCQNDCRGHCHYGCKNTWQGSCSGSSK